MTARAPSASRSLARRARRAARAALVVAFAAALSRPAPAAPHEVYWQSGGGYFGGNSRVVAGYGGGPGFRQYLSSSLALHVQARWLLLLGNALAASTGLSYEFHVGAWAPSLGGQLTAYVGNQVRLVTPEHPDAPGPIAFATELHAAPLRFVRGFVSASALGVDAGLGLDRGSAVPAFAFTLLEMGYRFE